LFFLMVIFSALGRLFFSLLTILMNSFRSLISFGYSSCQRYLKCLPLYDPFIIINTNPKLSQT
jgi:hypothetical protein